MFGLFKSKGEKPEEKERKARAETPESRQFKEFAARFLPEELTILAVTGANGFGGGKSKGEELWTASIGLTAWMEEDSPEIHRGEFSLTTLADDNLMKFLKTRAPRDTIIWCKVRLSLDGDRLLLTNLPEQGFDPDLEAILREQKKPITFEEEGLGTFTLNRQVNWFETEVDWLGTGISLVFDRDENRADCLANAKALLAAAADWDGRIRAYAADELLDSANDWAEDEEITREQFMERMELESVEVREDGAFEFWFADGEMFYGHSIHVSGDLENGPDDAEMEG